MYTVDIHNNQIIWETAKAYLIKMPKSKVWKFWISKKLVKEHGKMYRMLVWEDMVIETFSDAGNKKRLNSEEFLEAFGFDMDFDLEDELIDD